MKQLKEGYPLSHVPVIHNLVEWLVWHASWMQEMFAIGKDKRTVCERRQF